jgi:hypothetical protein
MDIEGSKSDIVRNDTSALGSCDTIITELHAGAPRVANPWGCSLNDLLMALFILGFSVKRARPPVYDVTRQGTDRAYPSAGASASRLTSRRVT